MKLKLTARLACAGLMIFALSCGALAQGEAQNSARPKKRLKIGLVLSGGGGRGLAHIGVLEWFEHNRIPVDFIAGTSIGGLVGAMYSIGLKPDEIRDFMKKIDWDRALIGGPTYEQLSFRRKEDRRDFQVNVELGLRHGISLPTSISSAHYVGLLMGRLTLAYSKVSSFDELPIPFRCTATDFVKAESVVLKEGSLSSAMRATMSIPGVFPPVERDGRVLVDGGLLNNIPTNVVREMGPPDVVIAVDVGTPLGDLESISSLPGILQQSITVMTIDNDRRNLRLADVIIAPELGDRSVLDFSDIDKAADLGVEAARRKAAILENFALDEREWQEHIALRRARERKEIPVPDDLQVAGVEASASRRIRDGLEDHIGEPLDVDRLEKDLTRITGQGKYSSLDYRFVRSPNSDREILLVNVHEKTHTPPAMILSAEIDGSDVNDINFTIGARLTLYDIGRYGAEWRNDVKVGFRTLFESEYYRPLGDGGLFVAPRATYSRDRQLFFSNGFRLAEFQTNRGGVGFDFGLGNTLSELRAGYQLDYFDAHPRTGGSSLAPLRGKVDFARVRWAYDGQNSASVPTEGLRLTAEGRWYFNAPGALGAFPRGEVSASIFRPVSHRGTIFFAGSGGTTFGETDAPTEQFTLGGPFRLGAYDRDEFRGSRYLLATAGYHRRVSDLPPLFGGNVYAIGWYETGGAFDRFNSGAIRNALAAGLIMDTRLGPFSIITSVGEGGRAKVYFAFGKFF
jgi:NTE family protein